MCRYFSKNQTLSSECDNYSLIPFNKKKPKDIFNKNAIIVDIINIHHYIITSNLQKIFQTL